MAMKMFVAGRSETHEGFSLSCSAGRGLIRLGLAMGLGCVLGLGAYGQTNVTMAHNDIARTGANTTETILTTANVNTNTFGKLFSQPVDGYVYAQPLYVAGVTINGATHNVVFVATEHDSVYAFDADSNGGANASPLWHASLLDAAHGAAAGATSVPATDVATSDIVPEVGITGTPVIDTNSKTIYVVSKTKENGTYVQRLHALDITTGAEKFSGPRTITASVAGVGNGSSGGTLNFDPKWENQRPGLLLLNGIVYIGYAAHGDNGPWHGWILAYNAATLQQTSAWTPSANSFGSGIWMGGAGLAADVPSGKPYGRMFTVTGNGAFDATPTYTNTMSYGDSILRLDLTNGAINVLDDFTPFNQATLNGGDMDQAAGGVLVLPDSVGGGNGNHQLLQLGKSGIIFVLNRENLGGYNPTNTKDPGNSGAVNNGLWGAPAYWNGQVYIWGKGDKLAMWGFANGALTSSNPTHTANEGVSGYSPTPSISSNGTSNGIVWSLKTENYASQGQATLYAHDATNLSLLYASTQNATRDNPGPSVKFVAPTVVNGKVFVGTENQLSVYGLLTGQSQAAAPVINPAGKTFTGTLSVTITDSTPGSSIFYTTDGSTPTTASIPYTAAITVNTTETISAIASATGYVTSPVAKQTYTLQTQVLMPTFSPSAGTYASAQTVTISDATPSSLIYYTTDGSTPSPGAGTTKQYTAPVSISTSTTINAIGTATGFTNSAVASSSYIISTGGSCGSGINFNLGFANAPACMTFNGSTGLDDTRLQLTNGGLNQAGSAFFNTPVDITKFTTDFTFQLSNAGADGITFTIQGNGPTALGPSGGGLGYGAGAAGGTGGIPKSVAVKFDTFSNAGEGPDSTGLYLNGASPTTPFVNLTGTGIDLHSDDTMSIHLVYDGTTLSMLITDPVANTTFSTSWPVNIPGTVGGTTAYVGFTGGTGTQTSSQKIGTWTMVSSSGQAATPPIFSLTAGTYLGTQTVSMTDATPGSSIFYTLDGTTPVTTAGGSTLVYTTPITVTATKTINAIATAPGYTASTVTTAVYTIETQVATPTFSPAAGTYASPQNVTISTTSAGATIYYTTDGSTPTKSSTQYTVPIAINSTMTVQAYAVASGFFDSAVGSATYTITSAAATPTFSPVGGTYNSTQNVTISDTTPGAVIYFTTNGTAPTTSSTVYTAPIAVTGSGTINAMATATGLSNSAVASATYTITTAPAAATPTFSPVGGTYSTTQNVTISDTTPGAVIYFTTNATAPTTSSTMYTAPIAVTGSGTIMAMATATGFSNSAVASATYTISSTTAAATPTFSPVGGTYSTTQNVTISDTTPGAVIYFTTNATAPTTSSTMYTAPIAVTGSGTIMAMATATGFSNSAVASATYTINTAAPDFTLSPASASLAVPAGGQGTDVITITPKNGFTSAVNLSCGVTGSTPMATCAFSAASVTPGASAVTSTLTISVPAATAMALPSGPALRGTILYAASIPLLLGIGLVGGLKKKGLNKWVLGGALAVLLLSIAACGSVNSNSPGAQTKNYMVTITAASGSIQHTTQVAVSAQ
jgi:Chitobiase/beta-hexosaminidase C-terminal domain/Legume lectin domain